MAYGTYKQTGLQMELLGSLNRGQIWICISKPSSRYRGESGEGSDLRRPATNWRRILSAQGIQAAISGVVIIVPRSYHESLRRPGEKICQSVQANLRLYLATKSKTTARQSVPDRYVHLPHGRSHLQTSLVPGLGYPLRRGIHGNPVPWNGARYSQHVYFLIDAASYEPLRTSWQDTFFLCCGTSLRKATRR